MSQLDQGAEAPAFDLPADGGARAALEALRGRPVVVYFYPKDDTSGCTNQALGFTACRPQFEEIGAEVVGISIDDTASKERFKAKHGLAVTLASADGTSVLQDYGVWTEKSMYGRKYMGIERTTFLIGRDGRVARVWRRVKVPGHAEEVLEALRAV